MRGAMDGVLRDSPFGQIVRFATRNKVFSYPEEDPNFQIPWEQAEASEKEKEIEAGADPSAVNSVVATPGALSPQTSVINRDDPEARPVLSTYPTARSSTRGELGPVNTITRTRTREQTLPYSRERFEVEQEEAIDRQQSSIIAPQRTADGVILVDWYTTDDPENPQNWNSWKKAWVAFIIWAYTFSVYAASAIYTSAEPQIMEKFGVGQSKASLGLSIYVLGYGTGPMVTSLHRPS